MNVAPLHEMFETRLNTAKTLEQQEKLAKATYHTVLQIVTTQPKDFPRDAFVRLLVISNPPKNSLSYLIRWWDDFKTLVLQLPKQAQQTLATTIVTC